MDYSLDLYLMQNFVCEIVDVDGQDLFAKCGFQMIEILRILIQLVQMSKLRQR